MGGLVQLSVRVQVAGSSDYGQINRTYCKPYEINYAFLGYGYQKGALHFGVHFGRALNQVFIKDLHICFIKDYNA